MSTQNTASETIRDVFKQIEVRFSNPFIFSYCSSWLVLNWKVLVILFYYDTSMLKEHGHLTYIGILKAYFENEAYFWCPFIIATAYTIGMPWVTAAIKVVQAWAQSWGEEKSLKAVGEKGVPVMKFMEMNDIAKKRILLLEDTIREQSTKAVELENKKDELIKLQGEFAQVVSELNEEKGKTIQQKRTYSDLLNSYNLITQSINKSDRMPKSFIGTWFFEKHDGENILPKEIDPLSIGNQSIIFSGMMPQRVTEVIYLNDSYIKFKVIEPITTEEHTYELIMIYESNWIGTTQISNGNRYIIRLYKESSRPDTIPVWVNNKTEIELLPEAILSSPSFRNFNKIGNNLPF